MFTIDRNLLKSFYTSLYTKNLYYLYNCLQEEKFTGKRNWNFGCSLARPGPKQNTKFGPGPVPDHLGLRDFKTDSFS